MNWCKMDANFDKHPQAIAAGWHASQIFLLLLRLSRSFDLKGVIRSKYLEPSFLRAYWGAPADFPFEAAIEALILAQLCNDRSEEDGGGIEIVGWRRWNQGEDPGSSTKRVQQFRQMKRDETNETLETARIDKRRVDKKRNKDMSANADDPVFAYWKMACRHPGARQDKKRLRTIEAARALRYSDEQLCKAIDGCTSSPYHMGDNKDGSIYDALTLILRDAEHIDKFIALAPDRIEKAKVPELRPPPGLELLWDMSGQGERLVLAKCRRAPDREGVAEIVMPDECTLDWAVERGLRIQWGRVLAKELLLTVGAA